MLHYPFNGGSEVHDSKGGIYVANPDDVDTAGQGRSNSGFARQLEIASRRKVPR